MDKIKTFINKRLALGSFARNVATLMTGATFSQALLIFIAPVLTRLYTPEDFGVFSMYISILSIITVVICLRYELAIVIPEKDDEAANLLIFSMLICIGLSFITFLFVLLFRNQLSTILNTPELAFWLWFLPISLLAAGLFNTFNYWSTRCKQFERLALRQITQSSVASAAQITLGVTNNLRAGGLIIGQIVGQSTATGRLAWQIWKDEGKQLLTYINKTKIKEMSVKYKNFPLYSTWSGLLNTMSVMLPPLLLGFFFNPSIVGFYALGDRVLKMPMCFVGSSVYQVFFPRATEAKRNGDLDRVTFNIFKHLISISLVPFFLLAIIAPELFALVFGDKWFIAGEYVRWLSFWIFFQFISSPISTVFFVLDKQKELLIFNFILIINSLIAFILGGLINDAFFAIKLFGISGSIIYLGFCLYILSISGTDMAKTISLIFNVIFKAIPFIIVPLLISITFDNTVFLLISAIFFGVIFVIFEARSLMKELI